MNDRSRFAGGKLVVAGAVLAVVVATAFAFPGSTGRPLDDPAELEAASAPTTTPCDPAVGDCAPGGSPDPSAGLLATAMRFVDAVGDMFGDEGDTALSRQIGRLVSVGAEMAGGSAGSSVTFTAGGDIGSNDNTTATLQAMASRKGEFFLALGDLSYSDVEPESAWCEYIQAHLGKEFPVQLVVGNHEDERRNDGYIGHFAECQPDRMDAVGTYGIEYYFDVGDLARVIMIGADIDVAGVEYDYDDGSDRAEWLQEAIDGAEGKSWVIVGMHKVCLTAGKKDCEIGPDLVERLIDSGVDLVLAGHDHNYQRSKQLRCAAVNSYRPDCVTDDGADGVYPAGEGTVFVISGLMGGGSFYPISDSDPEYQYMAATLGEGDPEAGYGFSAFSMDENEIHGEFVGTTTGFSDSFSIRRGP